MTLCIADHHVPNGIESPFRDRLVLGRGQKIFSTLWDFAAREVGIVQDDWGDDSLFIYRDSLKALQYTDAVTRFPMPEDYYDGTATTVQIWG